MYHKQKLIDKQTQDSLRIIDCLLRTLSSAENIAFGNIKVKKYRKYDDTDVCSWKKEEQIIDDFIMNIECLNTMVGIFKKRHNNQTFKFPIDQPKESILYDLQSYKMLIGQKHPRLISYCDDLRKLINGENCKRYSEKELIGSYKNENFEIDENKINKIGFNILNGAALEEKRIKKKLKKYERQGEMVEDLEDNYSDGNDDEYECQNMFID